MRKTFKYRLYPTRKQTAALSYQLAEACRLYNAALQERRAAYKQAGRSLTYYDQANQLKELRHENACGLVNFSTSQDVLRRVHKTFQAFFRRLARGEKPGYPRFKSRSRFDSVTFPSYGDGVRLRENGKLYLQGVGEIKVKLHRPVAGRIKTVTVKREAGRFYVCFSVDVEHAVPGSALTRDIGIDLGLSSFAVLSDGTVVDNPRWYRNAQRTLRLAQRRVARQLVMTYNMIFVEALNVKGMARGMLAKSVSDAGWAQFIQILTYKAEEAGSVVIGVNPSGTSQTCTCGTPVPKTLRKRWHQCPSCGLSAARDHVSALVIQRLGRSLVGLA